jgi:hypothetical protein
VSCYQCHAGGPSGHPEFKVWMASHGNEDINRCKACHGDNYRGGLADVSCYTCHETI